MVDLSMLSCHLLQTLEKPAVDSMKWENVPEEDFVISCTWSQSPENSEESCMAEVVVREDPDPDRHQHVEAEVEVLDGRTGKDQGVGREGQGQEVVNVVVVVIVGTEIDMEDTKLWKKFTQNILHI